MCVIRGGVANGNFVLFVFWTDPLSSFKYTNEVPCGDKAGQGGQLPGERYATNHQLRYNPPPKSLPLSCSHK